jgi:hypothetical protein
MEMGRGRRREDMLRSRERRGRKVRSGQKQRRSLWMTRNGSPHPPASNRGSS